MKYAKSSKGYIIVVGKMEPGEMSDEESYNETSSDPLSKYSSGQRGISFSEAGFELGKIGGKDTWIPSGESTEKFSVEGTSNKLSFQVVGNDKYNPILVDISGKVVKTDAFKELQGMSGMDLSSQLFTSIISEYSIGADEDECCPLMSALSSLSQES